MTIILNISLNNTQYCSGYLGYFLLRIKLKCVVYRGRETTPDRQAQHVPQTDEEAADIEETCKWLGKASLKESTEVLIMAAQEQTMNARSTEPTRT